MNKYDLEEIIEKGIKPFKESLYLATNLRKSVLKDFNTKIEKDTLILTGASINDPSIVENLKTLLECKDSMKELFQKMIDSVTNLDTESLLLKYSELADVVEKFYDTFEKAAEKIEWKNLSISEDDIRLLKVEDMSLWAVIHALMEAIILEFLPNKQLFEKEKPSILKYREICS